MEENQNNNLSNLSPVPKGIRDILPEDHQYLTYIKKVARHRSRQGGFRRIATPMMEREEFITAIHGKNSDLVKNNLYKFKDPEGNDMVLRPEGYSGIIRAYLAHEMKDWPQPIELYYIEPYFEFVPQEKKQFYRSYMEFGAVSIGEKAAALDAQLIYLAHKILQDLNIESLFQLQINHLGCEVCRPKYLMDLENYFVGKERSLCFSCQEKVANNPHYIFRCHEEDCQILSELAPKVNNYWCEDCSKFYNRLRSYLEALEISYRENLGLVGKYDFYTGLVFEYWDRDQKKENILLHGGSFDEVIGKISGEKIPAVGFNMRLEKAIKAMKKEKIKVPSKDNLQVFIAQLSREAKKKCLQLMISLREAGIKAIGVLGKGSIREQITLAEKFKVPYMIIMGLTEVRENIIILRDMKVGQQKVISYDDAVDVIKKLVGEENLDTYTEGELG
ncbi:hypothetical protein A2483_01805 [Candidatus Peregrinibacteria bacterium RIFOXYC2_FULL_33_13]|nr:MAG: histidyl-tRNA synthetase, histidyl-tRNA synthetase [Candidatus Peregrinibacteria bacterium GW2011_GWC2_33_13]OGJ52234.1 MAG: hypothetical protein A2483_01805 [Candidatus Peregrinibacteria bacterium RIFOXYC2_FULL_33_13]